MMLTFNHLKTFYNALKEKIKKSRGNWLQNDPTAEDYIKNKPFGTEEKPVTFAKDYEIYVEGAYDYGTFDMPMFFVLGKTYTVTVNGVSHNLIAEYCESCDCVILGNPAVLDEAYDGTGLDFVIDNYDDGAAYFNSYTIDTYVVTIKGTAEVVNQINEKYIPDTIARVSDIPDVIVPTKVSELYNDSGFVTEATVKNIINGSFTNAAEVPM